MLTTHCYWLHAFHKFLTILKFAFVFYFFTLFFFFIIIFLGIPRGSTFSSPELSRNALLNTCGIAKFGNPEYVQTHVLDRTVRTLEYVLKHFNKDSYGVVKNNPTKCSNTDSGMIEMTKNARNNNKTKNNRSNSNGEKDDLVGNSIMHQECSLQNLNIDLFSLLLETMVHQRTINQVLKNNAIFIFIFIFIYFYSFL